MTLLVTGASGFIGRNVLQRFCEEHDTVATYHSDATFEAFAASAIAPTTRIVSLDLTDRDQIEKLTRVARRFEACIYLAANGDPARSVPRPGFDLRANTLGLVNLLEQVDIERLVYFSSGAVYDGLIGTVTPQVAVQPRLPYAISKLASEMYVRHFQHVGNVQHAAIVRFFGAYGPHEPERKIYTRLVRCFGLARERRFTIRGDGRNLIDAMFVEDAVEAIRLLLANTSGMLTVDLASQTPLSLTALVQEAAATFGIEPEIVYEGEVPEYIRFQSSDPTMHARYGFAPRTALSDGLRQLAAHLAP